MPKFRYPEIPIAQQVEADANAVMLLIRRARATNAKIEDAIERSLQVIAESQDLLKRLDGDVQS